MRREGRERLRGAVISTCRGCHVHLRYSQVIKRPPEAVQIAYTPFSTGVRSAPNLPPSSSLYSFSSTCSPSTSLSFLSIFVFFFSAFLPYFPFSLFYFLILPSFFCSSLTFVFLASLLFILPIFLCLPFPLSYLPSP